MARLARLRHRSINVIDEVYAGVFAMSCTHCVQLCVDVPGSVWIHKFSHKHIALGMPWRIKPALAEFQARTA